MQPKLVLYLVCTCTDGLHQQPQGSFQDQQMHTACYPSARVTRLQPMQHFWQPVSNQLSSCTRGLLRLAVRAKRYLCAKSRAAGNQYLGCIQSVAQEAVSSLPSPAESCRLITAPQQQQTILLPQQRTVFEPLRPIPVVACHIQRPQPRITRPSTEFRLQMFGDRAAPNGM